MKYCPQCNKTKSLIEFYRTNHSKNGYQAYCKQCAIKNNKKYIYSAIDIAFEKTYNKKGSPREIEQFKEYYKSKYI